MPTIGRARWMSPADPWNTAPPTEYTPPALDTIQYPLPDLVDAPPTIGALDAACSGTRLRVVSAAAANAGCAIRPSPRPRFRMWLTREATACVGRSWAPAPFVTNATSTPATSDAAPMSPCRFARVLASLIAHPLVDHR